MDRFEATKTWQRAFEVRENDPDSSARQRLSSAFIAMREKVDSLVKRIDADCKGLTVHDVTHLDALWEMADVICGDQVPLTPAETFVLGGAILLHDAGMTAAAFGSLDELKLTPEWRDNAAAHFRQAEVPISTESLQSPPGELYSSILFATLRDLHAAQAEKLIERAWPAPADSGTISLIDDDKIRSAYGASVGRIAHSHHWPMQRVQDDLRSAVGAAVDMPPAWVVNEVKVACILRCADAMHVDYRRAPNMAFALNEPTGVSKDHWSFQNKLNQPTSRFDKLIYTSRSDFGPTDVDAWWLCVDTLRMIDQEISSSNVTLAEVADCTFTVGGVYAVDNLPALSKLIKTEGWVPVDAEVRVSDPVHLALTLGGSRLYGEGVLAPLRELLQNSADSIRALRKQEGYGPSYGVIRVVVERDGDGVILSVEDDGLGMSRAVMTGPLLDFGKSFWSSQLLRREFPGLAGKGLQPVGKFGIGFFSVFVLGDAVRVSSRRYDAGAADTEVLEFRSLARRPIVRKATAKERLSKASTCVRVRLKRPDAWIDAAAETADAIRQLIAALDVEVAYEDRTSGIAFRHSHEWTKVEPEQFLTELLGSDEEALAKRHAAHVRLIMAEDGEVFGRAALRLPDSEMHHASTSFISANGFITSEGSFSSDTIVGVRIGEVRTATRSSASSVVSRETMAIWATEQVTLIDQEAYSPWALVPVSRVVTSLGGESGSLPYVFAGNEFISRGRFIEILRTRRELKIPCERNYRENFEVMSFPELKSSYLLRKVDENVIVASERYVGSEGLGADISSRASNNEPFDADMSDTVIDHVKDRLGHVWKDIEAEWGVVACDVCRTKVYADKLLNSSGEKVSVVLYPGGAS